METSEEPDTCFSVVPTVKQMVSLMSKVMSRRLEEEYIEVGKAPDPRLDPDNFQLSEKLTRHMESILQRDRNQFEKFVYGCRVRDISLRSGMLIVQLLVCATFTDRRQFLRMTS